MLAFLALMALLFVLLTLFTTHRYFQETSQRLNQSLAKNLISSRTFLKDGKLDHDALEELYYDLMNLNPDMDIYLLDSYGHILSSSLSEGEVKQDHVSMEPVFKFLDGKSMFPILGDDPAMPDRRRVFSVCHLPVGGSSDGYLYIVLGQVYDRSTIANITSSRVLTNGIYAAVAGLVVIFLFAMMVFNQVTRRLRKLTLRVESFQEDALVDPADIIVDITGKGGDEIDRLGSTFARMEDRIQSQVDELTQADSLRRELITNISHDLRTPLTSLQGYLETLAFKEDLVPEERDRYMSTALKHSDRLRMLVSDLFELSKLDSSGVIITPEPFSLTELTQDVLLKFELAFKEKGVDLQSDFDHKLPFALGDIGRIERVLENLVKNALEHTQAGGTVKVTIWPDDGYAEVRVQDDGRGIPAEDLAHIFNPYYRVSGVPVDTDGTGLGLAITKRIVELHDSKVDVESEIDKGTTFSFRLPVVESG